MIVDMWLQACAFDIVSLQHTHNYMKKYAKMAMNITDEIDLDKELEVISVGISKSGVWEFLDSLPQIENIQNLYTNSSITIMIVFTVLKYLLDIVIVENFSITQLYLISTVKHQGRQVVSHTHCILMVNTLVNNVSSFLS